MLATEMTDADLILVTAEDCHLCEHAHGVLTRLGVAPREISVDSDEAVTLAAAGVPLVILPVLVEGGRLVAHGRFSEKRLRKELAP